MTTASEPGTVGNVDHASTASQPTTSTAGSSWLSKLNPFTGTSFLPNAALVLVGAVLAVSALVISQKQMVVKVASTVGELAA